MTKEEILGHVSLAGELGMAVKVVTLDNALRAMQEYATQEKQGWVKTSDRLPEKPDADENGKVLLYRLTTDNQTSSAKSIHDWNMVRHCDADTTFWMPLPQKPEV